MFDVIVEILVMDGCIELCNFGVFEVKKWVVCKVWNFWIGDKVEVFEKFVVIFKLGKEMEERVCLFEE